MKFFQSLTVSDVSTASEGSAEMHPAFLGFDRLGCHWICYYDHSELCDQKGRVLQMNAARQILFTLRKNAIFRRVGYGLTGK